MKETSFIEQNKEKWKKFEHMYRSGTGNPDELSRLFVEITEDLSYSRTHYPKRTVRVYLNGLAQQVFNSLYKIRNYPLRRFVQFWTKGLPLEVYRMQRDILFALIVFLVAAGIGVISTADDIDFARVILPGGYIDMTDANIDNNDPMAVYKSGGEFHSFTYIFFNNIRVSFFTFISGVLFGVGTLFFVLYNGIMVGTFQSYFYFKGLLVKKALLYTTFLTIWIHGAFEISAIVLAAAAGFTLGRSIMFPGTLTRLQSLQLGARRGLKMMVGLSVFILVAAILEGYVTRHTEMPEWLKLFIILGSFAIMIFLFVIFPRIVARKYPHEASVESNPAFNPQADLKLYKVRTFGEMVSDTFAVYRRNYKYFCKSIWLIAVPVTCVLTWFTFNQNRYFLNTWEDWQRTFGAVLGTGKFLSVFTGIIIPVMFAVVFISVAYHIQTKEEKKQLPGIWKLGLRKIIFLSVLVSVFTLAIQSEKTAVYLCFTFVAGFVFMPMCQYWFEGGGPGNAWATGMQKAGSQYSNSLGLYVVMMLLIIVFSFLLIFQGYYFFSELLKWHLITQVTDFIFIMQFVQAVLFIIFVFHVIPLLFIGFTVIFYHNEEIETSHDLFNRLEHFGKGRKMFESSQWE